jgi:hypothetical protein
LGIPNSISFRPNGLENLAPQKNPRSKPLAKESFVASVVGFTYDAMMDAIFVTSTSKCANRASMALGLFGNDLMADLLLAAPFTFWPLP